MNSYKHQFIREEVQEALKQMAPHKFPSPYGFSGCFYQSYWPIISSKVSKIVLKFLNEGVFNESINFTYIFLIPKVKNPVYAKDFKPISLCNVINNLAFKVLANRLKQLLPIIISKYQSVFIPKRLITDYKNSLWSIVYHENKTKRKGRQHGYKTRYGKDPMTKLNENC